MKAAELCAGYGGLLLAVKAVLGAETVWVAEYDDAPSRILAHHWPHVPNLRDLTAIDWHTCEAIDVMAGGYPCFTADAIVLTRDGYRPIADIRVGDLVLTHKRRWRPVTALMQKDAPETVVVRAQGTSRVRCTPEHPWWTQEGEWVDAKELAGRRVVQVLPESETRSEDLTPELLWVLGRHLADGYAQQRRGRGAGAGRITITCAHEETDDVLEGLAAAGLHGYVSRGRTATYVAITRNHVYQLAAQCGFGAENKHVPGWLLAQLDQVGAEALLSGYLSGDGSRQERTNPGWTATTISKALAYSMALVAQRARGVVCSVRLNRVAATKVIEGRTVNQRPFWTLTVPDRNRSGKVNGGTAYKRCRTVELDGPARVYNIAVDEDESYVVDNAVVHNCQPFSLAGQRAGTDDHRHLWPYIANGIGVLRPRMFIGENVRGHLSLGFGQVLADLHRLGYDVRWTICRASDVGAPHERARLYFVAFDRAVHPVPRPAGPVLARLEGGEWVGPDEGLFGAIPFVDRIPPAGAMVDGTIVAETPLTAQTASAGKLLPTPRTTDCNGPGMHGTGGMDLRTAVSLLDDSWGEYELAIRRWERVMRRPAPDPHMTSQTGGRQLAPAFAEWMQGLPDGHVTGVPGLSRAEQIKAIGNGVCPQQGAAAIRHLAAHALSVRVAA